MLPNVEKNKKFGKCPWRCHPNVRGKIAVARSQGHEGDALTESLEKRGGTSVLASLGMLLLFVGLWVAFEFLLSLEFTIF